MADAIVELVEAEEKETQLEGVELLASYFNVRDGVAIPKPNIADMFSKDILMQVGSNVADGFQADLDSMSEWSKFVKLGLDLAKQESDSKSTPWEGASNFKSPTLMQAALKFSDRASTELLRQEDIVKTSIIGQDIDGQKEKQANRQGGERNRCLPRSGTCRGSMVSGTCGPLGKGEHCAQRHCRIGICPVLTERAISVSHRETVRRNVYVAGWTCS